MLLNEEISSVIVIIVYLVCCTCDLKLSYGETLINIIVHLIHELDIVVTVVLRASLWPIWRAHLLVVLNHI